MVSYSPIESSICVYNLIILNKIARNGCLLEVTSIAKSPMEQRTLKKCKKLSVYQHLLLLRDIWWSKL